ncbi:MAG: PhzF family phenazine biosynthesis protein [Polyangiales bacterium]
MRLPIHQVDAFADRVFRGNPAAVVPLESWLPEATMQSIAAENNLSETAFIVREGAGYRIRWFTPVSEVPLCGHATLASAWVIFHALGHASDTIELQSASGSLFVRKRDDLLVLDFPTWRPQKVDFPEEAIAALGARPAEVLGRPGKVILAVYADEDRVRSLAPDFAALARHDLKAIVTAPGKEVDFVSRFFAPSEGIPEDPVTGSAHCTLIPYWAERLGKTTLRARQVSARGGELWCKLEGDRVEIAGHAVRYLEGTITLE